MYPKWTHFFLFVLQGAEILKFLVYHFQHIISHISETPQAKKAFCCMFDIFHSTKMLKIFMYPKWTILRSTLWDVYVSIRVLLQFGYYQMAEHCFNPKKLVLSVHSGSKFKIWGISGPEEHEFHQK